MKDEGVGQQVRRHIASEVRAEIARQGRTVTSASILLGKSLQAMSDQCRARSAFRPEELLILANWLEVDVVKFLPPGYTLMVVRPDAARAAS